MCFGLQPIDSTLLKLLIPVAFCHALGHVTSNVSFAAVAVSFTHTIKGKLPNLLMNQITFLDFVVFMKILLIHFSALEPFFNAAASQFILGQSIPITLWLSLAPVVIGKTLFPLAAFWCIIWTHKTTLRLRFLVLSYRFGFMWWYFCLDFYQCRCVNGILDWAFI